MILMYKDSGIKNIYNNFKMLTVFFSLERNPYFYMELVSRFTRFRFTRSFRGTQLPRKTRFTCMANPFEHVYVFLHRHQCGLLTRFVFIQLYLVTWV
jgi:hypothetical protein